jgi:anti-sigma-K factor RskA
MTNETQSHQVQPEDLMLYAMGTLDAPELARIGKHVEECIPCRRELQQINSELGLLAMTAPELVPSPSARQRLLAEIGRDRSRQAKASVWSWVWVAPSLVALGVLIALGMEWRNAKVLHEENARLQQQLASEQASSAQARAIAETIMAPDAMRLTLVTANAPKQPMAHAIYSREKARVFLMANHLAPLGPGKMYELWLLPKSGAPVPAGMFNSDEAWNAEMLHGGLPQGMEAKGFAISIEPEHGSAAPSQTPILLGTVS